MTTQFETFDQSPGGAFIETAFESRGPRGEVLPAGCCCAWGASWTLPTAQSAGFFTPFHYCFTLRWGPGVRVNTCSRTTGSWPSWEGGQTHSYVDVPDEATAEALCLGMPEGDRIREYEWVCGITADRPPDPPNWPPGQTQWNAPCHCNSASGEPVDFEERCGHLEGYCCALVLGEWELSPEGATTWQSHCTAEAQQKYYESPIEEVAFIQDPDDPEHPCPPDPSVPGWCCVTFQDLTTSSSLALGNEHEDACTVEGQLAAFAYLGLVVIAVNWLGQVDDDECNPCGIPEGSCCLTDVPPLGLCMMGLTAAECGDLPQSTFNRGIDACTNCYEPEPIDETPPWLGPSGRCCTSYLYRAPGSPTWTSQLDCSEREERGPSPSCEWFRNVRLNDPDHYQQVQSEWTINHECIRDLVDDGETTWTEQMCASIQGWCCREDDTGDATWRARDRCDRSGDRFYDPLTDKNELCGANRGQPCCRPNENGVLFCDVLQREECRRLGGIIKGEPGDDCHTRDDEGDLVAECEAGACCLGCSRCTDNMLPWHCDALVGQYRGHGTRCHEIDDCPEGAI